MFGLLYPLGSAFFRVGLHVAAFSGHEKARKAVAGRRGWAERLAVSANNAAVGKAGPWIHVHCASLGEYEQAAPLLQALRDRAPERPLLLTFFSPSGKEAVPADAADHVDYLPFDTLRNMRRFDAILPVADTVLVKYELWPRLIEVRLARGARLHLVAARFDPGRHPMGRWGGWIRQRLAQFTHLLVQDPGSAETLGTVGLRADVLGDPRVDRVLSTVQTPPNGAIQDRIDQIARWKDGRNLLVVGSAWEGDWKAVRHLLPALPGSGWCLLVAPHEVQGRHVESWAEESRFPRMSDSQPEDRMGADGLILDEVGLLKHVYGLGAAAIVGGGWGAGVHNTLEAAAFGLPLAVGPNIAGFREIEALRAEGGLVVCPTPHEMAETVGQWMSTEGESSREESGAAAAAWVSKQSGAAGRIADRVLDLRG